MILICDMNSEENPLGKYEFAKPISEIVRKQTRCKIVHFSKLDKKKAEKTDGIILSGTALRDNRYIKQTRTLEWIKTTTKPIMGVCAGMQTIAAIFECPHKSCYEIGMKKIYLRKKTDVLGNKDYLDVFSMHSKKIEVNEQFEVIAESKRCIHAIKHKRKNIWGILFHPEVRNEWIIEEFLKRIAV